MTKLETYKCDRCERHFDVPEDAELGKDTHHASLDEEIYDLCGDCFEVMNLCLSPKYQERIDNFLEKEIEKEL